MVVVWRDDSSLDSSRVVPVAPKAGHTSQTGCIRGSNLPMTVIGRRLFGLQGTTGLATGEALMPDDGHDSNDPSAASFWKGPAEKPIYLPVIPPRGRSAPSPMRGTYQVPAAGGGPCSTSGTSTGRPPYWQN